MSRQAGLAAGLAAAGLVAARWSWGRRAARPGSGTGPTVRTDDGVTLDVDVAGPRGARPTVVLVHGLAARSSVFDRQWAALRTHARLVRYDQRGHGRSGWAGSPSAGPARLGRDLGQVLDAVAGPGPVVLVGHSLGGMAVLALAGQRPDLFRDRVAGVALLSTAAMPLATAGRRLPRWARHPVLALGDTVAWLLWLLAPLVEALHPLRRAAARQALLRRLFAGRPPRTAARRMVDSWAGTPAAVTAALLAGLSGYDERTAAGCLGTVPVLVLAGADDATIPAAAARRLAARIGPGARLLLVPGAGHMVPLTHPEVVDAALLDLLARAGAQR